MIDINIQKSKVHDLVSDVVIDGHANYAKYGEDIVCAAVSTLMFTLIGSLDEVLKLDTKKYTYNINEDQVNISLNIDIKALTENERHDVRLLTSMFLTGIRGAIQDYDKYAKITIREV